MCSERIGACRRTAQGRAVHDHRRADDAIRPHDGVLLDRHRAPIQVLVGEDLVDVRHCVRGDALPLADLEPFGRRALRDDRAEVRVDDLRVDRSSGDVGEPRLVEQLLATDRCEQPSPVLVRVREQGDVAVARAVRTTGGREDAAVAGWLPFDGRTRQMLDEVEREHRVEHRHLDTLASPGPFPVEQRRQDGADDGLARDLVPDERGQERRGSDRRVAEPRETSRGLDDVVVRGPVLVGRAGAEALRLAVHEPRPRRREVGVGEAEAPERPGTKVRHEHVAGVEDAQERSQPIRMLHVERHGALVAVDVERDPRHLGMRPAAHEPVRVAAARLDLDDIRTEITEKLRRVRTHDDAGEIEHSNAVERSRRVGHGRTVV